MANMTAREQLMLELINRARMDPAGEAARFGIALNEGVPAEKTISTAAKQVLAGSDSLAVSSDAHSNWMFVNDAFAHVEAGGTGFTGAQPWDRMTAAGYAPALSFAAGENISFRGTTAALTDAQSTQWIYDQHRDLFVDSGYPDRGHRTNMLSSEWDEAGIGQRLGGGYDPPPTGGGEYNASLITQNFAVLNDRAFITGVVYSDTTVNDNFFTVGEEKAGVAVTATASGQANVTDTTGAGGGYELAFAASGSKVVTFDTPGDNVKVKVTLGATNIKIDVVNNVEVWSNASFTNQSSVATNLRALGISKLNITGADHAEKLYGNKAANKLDGNGGNDTISGGSGKDTIIGGVGKDSLTGGSSSDAFVFDATVGSSNADKITDFAVGSDKIHLTASLFAALGTEITSSEFHSRASGHVADSTDHIIYDRSDGTLWYDADDDGTGAAVLFATLTTKPADLSVNDFLVV